MRLRHVLVGLMCLVTTTTAGCSQACTLIGGESGFVIRNPGVLVERHAAELSVCVTERACATAPVPPAAGSADDPATRTLMVVTELPSRAPTTVTVTATDTQGVEVFRETVSVTPTVRYPNGKGCDPAVWRAAVTL